LSYLAFSLVSATLFLILISLATGSQCVARWQLIIGGYAFAWALGFVVPGAPAGLGVREAVLVGTLGGVFPENSVLISAVLFRVITTLGDSLFFLNATLVGVHPGAKLSKVEQ
jgi:glycosyltransferase 2 family protein